MIPNEDAALRTSDNHNTDSSPRPSSDKRNEVLRSLSRDFFELAVEAGKVGLWHWEPHNDVLTWSRQQEALYGLAEGTFGGKSADFHRFVLPEDCAKLTQDVCLRQNTDIEYGFRIRRPDGAVRWIHARSRTVFHPDGTVAYVTGINMDITEQKQAEEKTLESEENLRYTVEMNPQVPWTADADGNIDSFSERWLQLTGLTREQAMGNGWIQAPHPDDKAAMAAA